jgi:two-component system sensor histidine kinase YesM
MRTQVFAMLFSLLFVLSAFSCAIFYRNLSLYTGELLGQSIEILDLITANAEKELSHVEKLLLNIITNPNVTSSLKRLGAQTDLPERIDSFGYVRDEIAKYIELADYVESIAILSREGEKIAGTPDRSPLSPELRAAIVRYAEGSAQKGWVYFAGSGIFYVNTIPSDESKIIASRVSFDRLMGMLRTLTSHDSRILVLWDETSVYNNTPLSEGEFGLLAKDGVVTIAGRRYFAVGRLSDYTQWYYYMLLPYDSQAAKIQGVQLTIVLAFLAGLAVSIAMIVLFSKTLLRPVSLLSDNINLFLDEEFDVAHLAEPIPNARNEVYALYNEFRGIAERMNVLVKENYTKQLLIKQTEIEMLYAQINPHFLYNTLDSIYWLSVKGGQQTTASMAKALAMLFRHATSSKAHLVTIEEELGLLQEYITIQKIRHGDRLRIEIGIPAELRGCAIPKMALQPIVENSIVHVLEKQRGACSIAIAGEINGGAIDISVRDSGPGMPGGAIEGMGVGLRNVDMRIRSAFGAGYGLIIQEGSGVVAHIPYR